MARDATDPDQGSGPANRPHQGTVQQIGPRPRDFLSGPDTRLRDLLAFALAAEAGRALTPDGIEALRKKAEAELQVHALRTLHNRVETIRHEAVADFVARMPRGLSFSRVVIANLVAIGVAGVLALATMSGEPPLLDALGDVLGQIVARLFAGP